MNTSSTLSADRIADAGAARGKSAFKSIFIVASGNFLEMFDFMVFGYYATYISKAFFPTGSEFASLLLTLMTFGAGFLMRPVGALVLGAYVDRHGRRKGLLLTLGLMAVGTLAIAVTPTYAQIGLAAPLIILAGRLVQGLSAGVEVGGVSVYLNEIAPPHRKGFFTAWQSASQQAAVVFAALIGLLVSSNLSPETMQDWGWRVPFVIGCAMIPFLFLIRRHVEETDAFLNRKEHPQIGQIMRMIGSNWGLVLQGTLMAVMTTVFFYMVTAYTPTYGSKVLKLGPGESLFITACVGITNFVLLPVMGALSDRIGRRPLLIGATALAAVMTYPLMLWLVASPSFGGLLTAELLMAAVYATYNGAFIVYLTEVIPAHVRTVGFSLAYSMATAIFGGFTPAICTALIEATGDKAIPGAWCAAAALLSLLALLIGGRLNRQA
ncbi:MULTISPECIES: MFS transporter [unclassified Novosphingobium]|uniref:MFS transporter n=1 Tax=unclassified Novosphingobium TaxID=2644732 RepID=UPI000AAE7C07|nr:MULTISPECIES: MFS transporter [unclassified Novosphingobium]MBN9143358.1 MFS transporter [Novosphingobium sp.]MDR6706606.1 MFS family permease [Novosphingobium sp. 1748]